MTRQYAAQARGNAESDAAVRRIAEVARTAELEQLAAGLAHHINQPLGAIAAYAQAGSRVVAGSSPHADQAAAIFREITRLALEAGADVGQIRSRYTAQSAAPSRCRIEGVIAQLEPMLQRIAAAHGGSLELDVESGLPEVRIDAARIQYVLASLVRHGFAGAHRSADAPRVRIELRAEAGGIVISVIAAGACPPA
ncbi:MAG TPA: hypothetical protein VMU86_07380, partial [Steroidobacteraceae bacterium]|nr:hypothetical protein [Steroidobacteraceae bacterium]